MRIGTFNSGWWEAACGALSHQAVILPAPTAAEGGTYAADLSIRFRGGVALAERLGRQPVDLLLDNGGAGLGFVAGADGADDLRLAHEAAGRVLVSHLIDPVSTAFQGLDWRLLWQCLHSDTWVKAVWDRPQALELQRFGVRNVVHLPMAASNRPYEVTPVDPKQCRPIVSFVGGQNTSFFAPDRAAPTSALLAGALAHAVRADLPRLWFHDIYHDLYGLGALPTEGDDLDVRCGKALAYFNAKLFFNASLCIANRDRFVIFLSRRLGDRFQLVGAGWEKAYGLNTATPFPTTDAYLRHFRETAVNLNLVNGNAESGLNMRHFEITAAGGFMLCRRQPELEECFEIGKECAVFTDEADLLEKIEYYLAHPDERAAIALAGQRRTLAQHLYSHRLRTLLEMLQPRRAPVELAATNFWDDLRSFVPHPDVILDCGANVGQMARAFRNAFPKADVYSFEPVSSVFDQLRGVCAEVGAHAIKKAVGDHDGPAVIHLTASPEANSLLGFQEGNPCARWTREVGEEAIEVCTLDRWCREAGIDPKRVDVIKLDVQGAELKALYGARKLLGTVKAVYLEVSFVPIYKDGPLFHEIDRFLGECGYRRHAAYPSDQPHHWGDALYIRECPVGTP